MQEFEKQHFREGLEMLKLAFDMECQEEARKISEKLLKDIKNDKRTET